MKQNIYFSSNDFKDGCLPPILCGHIEINSCKNLWFKVRTYCRIPHSLFLSLCLSPIASSWNEIVLQKACCVRLSVLRALFSVLRDYKLIVWWFALGLSDYWRAGDSYLITRASFSFLINRRLIQLLSLSLREFMTCPATLRLASSCEVSSYS